MFASMSTFHLSSILRLSSYLSPHCLYHPSSIQFYVQNSLASLFYLIQQSHCSLLSQYVNRQITLEMKRNCPCTTSSPHVQPQLHELKRLHVYQSRKESHVSRPRLNMWSSMSPTITQFVEFVFLRHIVFKDDSTCEEHNEFITCWMFKTATVVQWSGFLATDTEVSGSIPNATRFSEWQWVWNGVHSDS